MLKPEDRTLQRFAGHDALTACRNTEKALALAVEMGSVAAASAHAEKRVATAYKNGWTNSLITWAGITLAFRKAMKPTT